MIDNSIGVDISKDHLDVHQLVNGEAARFCNTPAGLCAFQLWLKGTPPDLVVYEPTGPYHRLLEVKLAGRLPLVKVNPLQARRFAQAHGASLRRTALRSGARRARQNGQG